MPHLLGPPVVQCVCVGVLHAVMRHWKDERPREGSDLNTCLLLCVMLVRCRQEVRTNPPLIGLRLRPNQPEPAVTRKSMLGHQSHQVSMETLAASPIGPLRRPTPTHPAPLFLFLPLKCNYCQIGAAMLVSSITSKCPKTPVRNEAALLIYGAIDMKITMSGNKIVIICPCFSMWREMNECGC